jgi:hypothetical protein
MIRTTRWGPLALFCCALGSTPSPVSAQDQAPTQAPEQVGKPPEEPEPRPEVTNLTEVGGVLTPPGYLRIEPLIEFSHTSFNRFNVNGFELVQGTILFGQISAFESDRDTLLQSLTLRYGLTRRLDFDLTIPALYRDERFANTIPVACVDPNDPTCDAGETTTTTRNLDEYGLGDIDAGIHWQVNSGADGYPFLVANLRAKSDTGTGPFEVGRDLSTGTETELATGSGFWSVNPSFTLIAPAGPAVLFGNIGYLWNLEPSVDERVRTDLVVTGVDPGDVIQLNIGLGVALTEDLSFNLGFDYNFDRPTDTTSILTDTNSGTVTKFDSSSSELQVGSLQFGLGYRFSPTYSAQVNAAIGATDDTPDFRISLRLPISLALFD